MLKLKRLSTFKIRKIISTFCADINTLKAALLPGINRKSQCNTINKYYNEFRRAIYARQMRDSRDSSKKQRLMKAISVADASADSEENSSGEKELCSTPKRTSLI